MIKYRNKMGWLSQLCKDKTHVGQSCEYSSQTDTINWWKLEQFEEFSFLFWPWCTLVNIYESFF